MAKKTCLYDMHLKSGGKIVDFAGYDMPIQYEGIVAEHEATRTAVGMFDVSHMGKFMVKGENAEDAINKLITNDIADMVDGQAIYSPMCYENGGTVDDILVYRQTPGNYLLVVNASNRDKDYQWIESHLSQDVMLQDITETICQIALQGPKALALLQQSTETDISAIDYYHFMQQVMVADTPMLVSRTGYTGEDGFELYFSSDQAHRIWQHFLDRGTAYDLKPCGLGARDTLRFEAGMPLYGNELSEEINPVEAGLNYFIKFEDHDFIGREALMAYKENRQRKLIGFELTDKGMPRHGAEVVDQDGQVIGEVTTGYKSPTFDRVLGFALVPWSYSDDTLHIKVRKKTLTAKIINKRFLKTYKNN